MNAIKYMEEEMVIKKGVDLLMKGLGPLETLRFLQLPSKKRLDIVKQHRVWQSGLNSKQFLDDVFSE
ncbi:MAG: hypothetical protein WCK54_06635 [Desulfuromonadales bacterium]